MTKALAKSFPIALLILMIGNHKHASAQEPVGIFTHHGDVGQPERPGSATFDEQSGEYVIEGSGKNIWFDTDEFHFAYKKYTGDFIVRARARFIGDGVDPHRKIGWMARNALDGSSAHVSAVLHGDGLTSLQYRKTSGGATEQAVADIQGADILQLERKGSTFIMSAAHFGEPFVVVRAENLPLMEEVFIGLFTCAHNEEVSETAVFNNVRIVKPVKEDFVPYQDYIGSHIEIMNIDDGVRTIVYSSQKSLQAPNWTTDGKALIYNSEGLLYKLDLTTRQPAVIDTDFADDNNNDHVLSFDGKQIAISHHSAEDNRTSIIYRLPADGGKPERVTGKGPSYLHGWSPDDQYLVYTGGRNGNYDIYKIPAAGGEEIRLTESQALDDGPEFSPDGEYIYFNSTRTGLMQIWRMKPDGSNQEQVTFDNYNNWFPHFSPDGKWIVFLSYYTKIDPEDHPFYKHVYLRLMPASGGEPKIIGYVYGGQGTINVPSWSPDSKRIAFVSNSDLE